jgi:hypothetical protein
MAQWVLRYLFQNRLDLAEEFKAQSVPSLLVPLKPFRQVRFSFWTDDVRITHFGFEVMRSYTSCHEEPAAGSLWREARRSSINRLSSSVNSRASGASAMLFQMSSTSCNRSGTGNCNNSDAENLFIARNVTAGRPGFNCSFRGGRRGLTEKIGILNRRKRRKRRTEEKNLCLLCCLLFKSMVC